MSRPVKRGNEFVYLDFHQYIVDAMFNGDASKCRLEPSMQPKFEELCLRYIEVQPAERVKDLGKRLGLEKKDFNLRGKFAKRLLTDLWGIQQLSAPGEIVVPVDLRYMPTFDKIEVLRSTVCSDAMVGKYFAGTFDGCEVGGVLRGKHLVPNTQEDAAVLPRLVQGYGLRNGDLIEGWGSYVDSCHYFCLFCITKINGNEVNSSLNKPVGFAQTRRAKEYEKYLAERATITPAPVQTRIKFDDNGELLPLYINTFTPIAEGQSLLISYNNRYDATGEMIKLRNTLKASGNFDTVVTLALATDCKAPADAGALEVFTPVDSQENSGVISRATGYVREAAYRGEKVVVLVNALEIASSPQLARQLISEAKKYSNGGSVTVIAFIGTDASMDNYLLARASATAELKLVVRPFARDYYVNVSQCFSACDELLGADDKSVRNELVERLSRQSDEDVTKHVATFNGYDSIVRLFAGGGVRR